MVARLSLQVGTLIIAVRDVGPVREGTPGIITGTVEVPFFWWSRPFYLCTFANGVPLAVRPKEIEVFDHGFSRTELEDYDNVPDREVRIQAQTVKITERFAAMIQREHQSGGKR